MELSPSLRRWAMVAARTLIAIIFVYSVYGKLTGWQGTVGYVASKGLPFPALLLVAAEILEIGGLLLMVTGLRPRIGAVMLLAFLIPVTLIMHNFWAVPDAERQMQMTNFLKNLAIIGGLGMVACTDWKRESAHV